MNLNVLTVFQQSILAILILFGNIVFVSTFVVIIRRHFSQRELYNLLENSKRSRKVRNEFDQEEGNDSTQPASNGRLREGLAAGSPDDAITSSADDAIQPTLCDDATVRRRGKSAMQPASNHGRRRNRYHSGLGFFLAPWQISGVRKAFCWMFRSTDEPSLEKNHHHYLSFVPTLDNKVGFL